MNLNVNSFNNFDTRRFCSFSKMMLVSSQHRINLSYFLLSLTFLCLIYFCLVFIWSGARLATDLRHVADNRLLSLRQNWLKHGMPILATAKIIVCGVSHAGRSDRGRQTGLNGILGSVIQKAHLTTNLGFLILIQVPVSFIPNHFFCWLFN